MSLVCAWCGRGFPRNTRQYRRQALPRKIDSLELIHRLERCMLEFVERLNYHHLLYFWMVAREGTVARASEQLRLAQPTLSGQIRTLQGALGEKLFERAGRNLRLTEMGRVEFRYADEIFSLGRELVDSVKGRPTGRPLRLAAGVADGLPKLAAKYRRRFPRALDGAPFLLPGEGSTLRSAVDQWLEKHRIRPRVVGEFDDSALIKVFGQAGGGIFAAPSIIESSVCRQYGVALVGKMDDDARERFYAISVERRLKHPAAIAITESARRSLFG